MYRRCCAPGELRRSAPPVLSPPSPRAIRPAPSRLARASERLPAGSILLLVDVAPRVALIEDVSSVAARRVADATRHQLGESVPSTEATSRDGLPPLGAAWTAPVLEVFTDMEDLLLLDPIHDVSEAVGWPMQKPAHSAE